ncbi:hypothetical protein PCYB_112930, partial [Plasmodium cynomolgi strain B]
KTPSVLCEFNVDAEKKIYFHNLFNFNLIDVLTIFKLLLQLRKVTLYKHNDNISFAVREIKKGDNSYKSTIRTYLLFLKKYLLRNEHGEDALLDHLKKDIAVMSLVSTNKSFIKIEKSKIAVDPFYVKYYYKYHLNKLLCLSEELFLSGGKPIKEGNLIHLSQMETCTGRGEERGQGEFSSQENIPIWSRQTIPNEADNKHSIKTNPVTRLKKDGINIKVINVYLNGKFSVALPLVLTYNINKDIFYLNDLFYLDGSKYDVGSILTRREIYFNNLSFFQWKNFSYLNNENIILNSDNLHFDLNYILLFYHLYFNEGEKLCIRRHINPTFYFYPPVGSKKGANPKRVERIVYRADKKVLNFVF